MKIKLLSIAPLLLLASSVLAGPTITIHGKGGSITRPDGTIVVCPESHFSSCAVVKPESPQQLPSFFVLGEVYLLETSEGTKRMELTELYTDANNQAPQGSELGFRELE